MSALADRTKTVRSPISERPGVGHDQDGAEEPSVAVKHVAGGLCLHLAHLFLRLHS